eukprot:365408-Chlamydomonas_euryale.AAC.5
MRAVGPTHARGRGGKGSGVEKGWRTGGSKRRTGGAKGEAVTPPLASVDGVEGVEGATGTVIQVGGAGLSHALAMSSLFWGRWQAISLCGPWPAWHLHEVILCFGGGGRQSDFGTWPAWRLHEALRWLRR